MGDLNNMVLKKGEMCYSNCGKEGAEICPQRVISEGLMMEKHPHCTSNVECVGQTRRVLCSPRAETGADKAEAADFEEQPEVSGSSLSAVGPGACCLVAIATGAAGASIGGRLASHWRCSL